MSPSTAAGAGGREDGTGRDELRGPWRWLSLPLEWAVRLYQLLISPLLPPSCRFYPSCSAYGLTALRRWGPLRGTWMTVCRVARCHPWNPGGVDHVPLRGPDGSPVRDDGWRRELDDDTDRSSTPPGAGD